MTIEKDLNRIALALESISNNLQRLADPPIMRAPDALDQLLDEHPGVPGSIAPLSEAPPPDWAPPGQQPPQTQIDPSVAFISGQWKRRQGHELYDTGSAAARGAKGSSGPLDPWVRVDVPNVEPAAGQLGIKEDGNGKATDRQSNREG